MVLKDELDDEELVVLEETELVTPGFDVEVVVDVVPGEGDNTRYAPTAAATMMITTTTIAIV